MPKQNVTGEAESRDAGPIWPTNYMEMENEIVLTAPTLSFMLRAFGDLAKKLWENGQQSVRREATASLAIAESYARLDGYKYHSIQPSAPTLPPTPCYSK